MVVLLNQIIIVEEVYSFVQVSMIQALFSDKEDGWGLYCKDSYESESNQTLIFQKFCQINKMRQIKYICE